MTICNWNKPRNLRENVNISFPNKDDNYKGVLQH